MINVDCLIEFQVPMVSSSVWWSTSTTGSAQTSTQADKQRNLFIGEKITTYGTMYT